MTKKKLQVATNGYEWLRVGIDTVHLDTILLLAIFILVHPCADTHSLAHAAHAHGARPRPRRPAILESLGRPSRLATAIDLCSIGSTSPRATSDPASVSKTSRDSSQLTERALLDDLFPWIPTCNALYATLIEHGYSLTPQGRVVVYLNDHVKAVFHRFYQVYLFDAPSPVAPTFIFSTTVAPQAATAPPTSDRSLNSGSQAAAPTAALIASIVPS
eukprot:6213972-Pleurochrysis_carterae.AAC.1